MDAEHESRRASLAPADEEALAELVAEAAGARRPLLPIGGGTTLRGADPSARGEVLLVSLDGMQDCREHAARDLTITVGAGMCLAALEERLAAAGQRLGVECAQASRATVGGALACDASGPRSFGCGTLRDALIGVRAVDGRGRRFRAGGRVVKNVAGYDFMKLLVGSRGSLAVITEATFKLQPRPEALGLALCGCAGVAEADALLEALTVSSARPVALDLLDAGAATGLPAPPPPGALVLAVAVEGSRPAVAWQLERLAAELSAAGVEAPRIVGGESAQAHLAALTELPHSGGDLVELAVLPSQSAALVVRLAGHGMRVIARAGSGRIHAVVAPGAGEAARERLAGATTEAGAAVRVWRWSAVSPPPAGRRNPGAEAVAARLRAVFDPAGILPPLPARAGSAQSAEATG